MKHISCLGLFLVLLSGCMTTQRVQTQAGPAPADEQRLSDADLFTINAVAGARKGWIELIDGSRLRARRMRVGPNEVLWQDSGGQERRTSLRKVRKLMIRRGRLVNLLKYLAGGVAAGALLGFAGCGNREEGLPEPCGKNVAQGAVLGSLFAVHPVTWLWEFRLHQFAISHPKQSDE
jgi:hypothetical protein